MLRKISLYNKPLSLEYESENVYFGDSRGYIFKTSYPFLSVSKIYDVDSPVSSLVWYGGKMFYGTWDGEIGITDFKTKHSIGIVRDLVKSMTVFKNHVFVSIDHIVYIYNLDLELVDKIETPHKVLCFYSENDTCLVGMGVPFLGQIKLEDGSFKLHIISRTVHDTSILSIHKDLIGSSDGKITRMGNVTMFSSTGWIRSIFNGELFSCGKKVISKLSEIYAHEDEVMGVLRIRDKILSIGLDYTLCIFEEDSLLEDELREIEELNRLF
ncbi:hypothetical protein NGRA_0234 [Nosema granulosis]|uniref:Uncharacterized protein n=1 Tax=Nosema granulosis TaxID=83296 RepID=A0A9P6L0J4_9MICR|nr:hypothetical protein NGRA_0234 [Nosema granulosis]